MNKLFLLVAGILLMGLVIGAGGVVSTLASKDVELVYSDVKLENSFSRNEMLDFNDIKYEVRGNTIILNKKGLFQNREIVFSEEQTCLAWTKPICTEWSVPECLEMEVRKPINCLKLEEGIEPIEGEVSREANCIEWEAPRDCIEFDSKIGVCNKYKTELRCLKESETTCLKESESVCSNWTKYTKDYFIQQRIKTEIEFVKEVQTNRANKTRIDVNETGKVIIK